MPHVLVALLRVWMTGFVLAFSFIALIDGGVPDDERTPLPGMLMASASWPFLLVGLIACWRDQ